MAILLVSDIHNYLTAFKQMYGLAQAINREARAHEEKGIEPIDEIWTVGDDIGGYGPELVDTLEFIMERPPETETFDASRFTPKAIHIHDQWSRVEPIVRSPPHDFDPDPENTIPIRPTSPGNHGIVTIERVEAGKEYEYVDPKSGKGDPTKRFSKRAQHTLNACLTHEFGGYDTKPFAVELIPLLYSSVPDDQRLNPNEIGGEIERLILNQEFQEMERKMDADRGRGRGRGRDRSPQSTTSRSIDTLWVKLYEIAKKRNIVVDDPNNPGNPRHHTEILEELYKHVKGAQDFYGLIPSGNLEKMATARKRLERTIPALAWYMELVDNMKEKVELQGRALPVFVCHDDPETPGSNLYVGEPMDEKDKGLYTSSLKTLAKLDNGKVYVHGHTHGMATIHYADTPEFGRESSNGDIQGKAILNTGSIGDPRMRDDNNRKIFRATGILLYTHLRNPRYCARVIHTPYSRDAVVDKMKVANFNEKEGISPFMK